MEQIKLLLEDYQRRLKTIDTKINTNINNGSINDIKRTERFVTKKSEYKTFIRDLEALYVKMTVCNCCGRELPNKPNYCNICDNDE